MKQLSLGMGEVVMFVSSPLQKPRKVMGDPEGEGPNLRERIRVKEGATA